MKSRFISIIIVLFALVGCEKNIPVTEDALLGSWRAVRMDRTNSTPNSGFTIIYGSLDTSNYRRFYHDQFGVFSIEHGNGFVTYANLDVEDYIEEYFFLGPTRDRETILWHIEKMTATRMVVTNNLGTGRTWTFEKY